MTDFIAFIALAIMMGVLIGAFYTSISRELCRRDLSPADYAEMKLDCEAWPYR
jgi:hypothetical protein